MKIDDIIINLSNMMQVPVGRHLYGVIGTYESLEKVENALVKAPRFGEELFPKPKSLNLELIDAYSDSEFRSLVEDEAKRPEPTRASLRNVFEKFMRESLEKENLLILKDLELLFIYNIDFSVLRVLSTDIHRVVLLLPGRRSLGRVIMYPESQYDFHLPQNLIADNHLWEISE